MAQQAPFRSPSLLVSNAAKTCRFLLLQATPAATTVAQIPQQQYVFGSVPLTPATSHLPPTRRTAKPALCPRWPARRLLTACKAARWPSTASVTFRSWLIPAPATSPCFRSIRVPEASRKCPARPSPPAPPKTPPWPRPLPCLAAEKTGQFLYVGYRFGNFVNQCAVNEYLIDAANGQLVPLSGQPTTDIASAPIGMVTDPKGLHLYVGLGFNPSTGVQDAGTNVYSIDPVTGVLGLTGAAGNAISACSKGQRQRFTPSTRQRARWPFLPPP
jgi:hypothetical protein